MNTALLRWRKRLASSAAAWIAVTMAVASLLPLSPASADETGVGDPVYVANKMQGYGGTALVGIFANTPPDIGNLGTPDYWGYCVEHDIPVGTFRTATLEAPPSYLGSNYFTNAAIQAKVHWVLAHSYPYLSLSDFGTAAGVPGISANDAIEAAQYAIWRYTDLNFDASWSWETPDSETAYWYLVNGANASSGMTPPELQSTVAIAAPGGAHTAGTLVGPFTVSTNQPTASVSVTGGYTLTNAGGTPIDTSAVTNGQDIYIDLTGVTAAGSATVTVSAAGSSISGNIVSVPATAGGVATAGSHAQTLMIVAPSTFRVTDSAAVSWVSGAPAPAFCPAAGDPAQVFSIVNGVNIYGYTPGTPSDALLPLLPATVSGNLNALMLDPLRDRLLMIQRSSGTQSTLWAYDSGNGGWYVASGPFVSPDFPRGGFNASGTGYLLGGGASPEVWEVESSSTFGYTVTPVGVMNYDQAPTDFSSGDIAFDGSGTAWLAVGQDLYHLDLSGSSPFTAVRQTRPLLGGSPSTIGWAGIAFAGDGTLILANNAPSPSAYYQYDPATGVIVHLSNTTANASRDLASCVFPAQSEPVLSVAKTLTAVNGAPYVPPAAVSPGDTLTYTLTITNSGGAAATLFAGDVVETVPAETTHTGGDSFTCTAATAGSSCGNTSTFNVAAGASADLTFTVQVDATTSGDPIINAVAIPGEVDCAVAPNDCEEATPVTSPPSMTIAKALTGESGSVAGQAEPGEQLTYTITLTNTGGSAATGYGVTDALDPNTGFVSASNGGSHAAGVVTWTNLTVPAGGSLALTVVVTVNDPLPAGVAQIANVAYATGTPPPPCPPAGGQCVVIPTAPSVAIAKALTGESGSLAGQAEPGEQLTYTITLTNTGGSAATGYGVTDALDPNTGFASASNGGSHAAGVVTWTNLTVPAGGSLALTVVVTVNDPLPGGVTQIANLAYETGTPPPPCPPAGGQCVIVPTAPQVSIVKAAGMPAPTGVPNQYALTYVVTVHNAGGSIGAYDLADTLTFNGAAVTAVTVPAYASSSGEVQDGVPGVFTPPTGGTIVTGELIGAQGSETWTYTVTYTVDDADLAADCISPSGGLRNHALLGGASAGPPAADTCTGAPSVSIVKTAAAPVPTGMPNQFTLTYTVEVANTGTLPGAYDLADALTFNGATVDTISAPAYTSSTDTQDGTLGAFTAPAGGTIVSDESISADGTETWTYTVTYTVTDAAAAQDCADPSRGLRNRAELGGSLGGQSTTCTGAPAVNIGKSASGPVPTGNPDEYRLTYLVNVQNDGSLPGTYDLADTFTFSGVTVVSVGAVQHGGSDPLATPVGTLTATGGTIVTGETIAAGASESYTYTVTFTIDDVNAVGTCATDGGLKNQAELGGSSSGQVGTCSDVPDIAVTKTATGPAPTGAASQYAITYTVAISNTGAAAGSYDLSDAFTFAGATVDAVSAVTHAGPDPLATTLGTLTATGGTIVTGETIAAAGVETYTYTVTFTLTDPALADDCSNPAGGLRNVAMLGGSASGEARTCNGTPVVAIAKALTGESGSAAGVAEPGEQLTYTITLTNSGTAPALDQRVADRLDPNVTFVSADNGGTQVGGNVEWTGLTVPAGGSLALSVTVRVADPIPAGVTAIGNVAYDPTIGPPTDCSVTPLPPNCTTTPTPAVVAIVKALAGESGSTAGVAEAGEQLTYTITLTNTGGSDATGYGVTDALDPNTTFVSADNGGVAAGGTVTWSGLTVPANGSLVLTVVVRVADPLPAGVTQVANVAYETGTPPPACPPAGGQCVVIPTEGAVAIVKALAGESGSAAGVAEPGEQLTYTITLTNTGGSDATGYGVTDALDPNTTFVSADNGGVAAGGTVTWSSLTVPANGSLVLTVVVRVADPLPAGVTQVANVAYETGTTPPACPPAGGQCVVIPTEGAVAIVKALAGESGSAAGVAEPGEQLTYTITLTNTGGSNATNYGVEDRLDPNTSFVSASHGGMFAAGVVTWSGLTVPANGSLTPTVVVRVADPLPAGVTQVANVAYETGTPPPPCPPAGGQCVVVPTAGAVTIVKSVADASGDGLAQPGEQLTYTIALTNTGGSAATNYGVTDPLDANTVFVSADNGGTFAAGVVSWSGLTVPANGTLTLTVVVRVVDPVPPGVTQIGNVAYETGTPPPDCEATPRPANCTSIEVPPPAGTPQLLITKTAGSATLRPGGTVVYTITVSNVGNADATGVLISDPIPAGIAAFAWTCAASGGVACPNASGSGAIAETIATFPVGAALVYTVTATISADPPATVVNTATVTPGGIATCAPAGTQPPCPATVIGRVTPAAQAPLPVPAVHDWAQLLIALSLFGLAWHSWRRAGR